jgi:hypothetical protein
MPSFRLKRGDSTKVGSYVGNEGELIYNTETKKVHVMDGSTSGGAVVSGTSPTALSELTNDAGFVTTAQIPTNLSELTNDVGFATGTIPTALSQLTNDVGFVNSAGGAVTTQEYTERTAFESTGFGTTFNCISHTFTNIPAGATILFTVQGTLRWILPSQSSPPTAMITFKPNGNQDALWRFDVRSEDRDFREFCTQGFSFTYKPYVVTNAGDFLMQVEITNYSQWTCQTNFDTVHPISLIALIIG